MMSSGERLAGRYELIQQIGAGGMATVWRARDLRLDRPVAVKLLRPELAEDEDLARRFESEARHAASLSHQNIAAVFDTDVDGAHRFIVMELVDGPSVADVIDQRGPLEPRVAVEIAAAAARALAAAHRRSLIHRDVKPANLLIGRDGRVRLADFGIARALTASRVTMPGTVLGSIPYLSPEQARGEEATAAGDVFSLGVVLYEMLTGRLPWDADTPAAMATVRLHVPAAPPSAAVRDLPAGLDAIVARALEIEPGRRYPSARVLADALESWNRRNPGGARARRSLVGATTALAASVTPSIAGMAAAVARPNPWAELPRGRGGTRRSEPPSGRPPTRRDRGAPPPELAPTVGQRRGEMVLAALAVGLLVVVAGALVLAPSGGAALPTSGAVLPAVSPSTGVDAGAPSTTPSFASTPSATPTAEPMAEPTPDPTPTPTPRPTSRPTPRPTPAPTQPPQTSAAAAAVVAFYDAVEDQDWETATDLWSPSMQERYPPDEWLVGRFRRTTRIDITSLRTVSLDRDAGTARVEVALVEYRTVEPSPRSFVGAWDLVKIDGRWLLNDPQF